MGTEMYVRLVMVLGVPEMATDPRYQTLQLRAKNRPQLNADIAAVTMQKTTKFWIDLLNQEGVPCGSIKNVQETMEDPQVQHLGMAKTLQHPKLGEISVVGQAVILSRSKRDVFTAAPDRGEHNEEVYAEFGVTPDRLAALRQEGAI
jgi:crotonobetainyl-CoA:carnitine CoA-transferase CaiB-like acyl-CoA transferase